MIVYWIDGWSVGWLVGSLDSWSVGGWVGCLVGCWLFGSLFFPVVCLLFVCWSVVGCQVVSRLVGLVDGLVSLLTCWRIVDMLLLVG